MPAAQRIPEMRPLIRPEFLAFIGVLISLALLIPAASADEHLAGFYSTKKSDPCVLLMKIYQEVLEMECPDEEEIIKGEFLIELDGNEENKEEYVVVMSHWSGDLKKIILQVTYFEPKTTKSIIKYAKTLKTISCQLKDERVEIRECDYKESEMQTLLPDILHGIKEKKKLLKLIDHKIPGR